MTVQNSPGSASTGVRHVTIDAEYAGQRLDNFLRTRLKGVPKSAVYRAIRKGEVRINGKRCSADDRIQDGDVVRIPPMRVAETSDVVVPVTLARQGAQTVATGAFPIRRLQFRIGENEWADTAMVADEVQVKFRLVLTGVAPL